MSDLIYRVEREDDITILTLMLDNVLLDENEELKETFAGFLDEGAKKILLDLSETSFISSIIIASLVFMMKRAKEAGGDLVLCGVRDKVAEVLRITNLDKVFEIFSEKEDALKKLKS
ncbi:MAG: STAS domain-containing protein [Candidatus Omnitrophica bacterium]|nr:STAS domain-containing protein [Candidatus Omnitrophota bacterium]